MALAATRLIPMRKNKGKSIGACLHNHTSYIQNPDKTEQGELVSSYQCSPLTVDEEFLLTKRLYEQTTGRSQKSDVIAYQVRQSFKPGEVTPEEANRIGSRDLHRKAEDVFRFAINAGWDQEYGGLLYFIDCMGLPPEAYEHDMKLWWPHNEILIASLMAYRDTRDETYLDWFYKTIAYCRDHFADPAYGEWYGYLRRDGKPTLPACKGSTFKGPFHVPRSLSMADKLIDEILAP